MRRGKRMMEELEQDIREHIAQETQDNINRECRRRKRETRFCASSAT